MTGRERLADAVAEATAASTADAVALYLPEGDGRMLHRAVVHERAPGTIPLPSEVGWGKGLIGGAAERAEPLADDAQRELAVPALLGDEALGALVAVRAVGRGFTPAEVDALLARGRRLARELAPAPLEALRMALARAAPAPGLAWLEAAIAGAGRGDRAAVLNAFPAVSRRLGKEPLGSRSALVVLDLPVEVPLRAWRIDDAGRVALLCAFPGDGEALARELYFGGDMRERSGALRALGVVGRGALAVDAVMDACRVSAVELFEPAVAENPYTARVLPDHEFRQAVLKAAFMGISVARIMRLEERADAELTRMLLSYVTEREVAGRSVPPDIWPVVAAHPAAGLVAKLCGYLEHPAEAHRVGAAVALGRIRDARARPFLEDRLARETDAVARRALERAIA
jgi:hypothetical protein